MEGRFWPYGAAEESRLSDAPNEWPVCGVPVPAGAVELSTL